MSKWQLYYAAGVRCDNSDYPAIAPGGGGGLLQQPRVQRGGRVTRDMFSRTTYYFIRAVSDGLSQETSLPAVNSCDFDAFPHCGQGLTLIAGLAGEARLALALIGSYALSMLTARLAHSCSWRI